MSNFTNAPSNFANSGLNLQDALDVTAREILLNLNCHAIGTVQSFNPLNRTVTCTINYQKTSVKQSANGTVSNTQSNYPIHTSMPVICLSGGPASITFPIQAGDICLVLFNDRDMDNYIVSGQVGPVNTGRLHSFADGIALVGLLPYPVAAATAPPYDQTHLNLRVSGDARVRISNTTTSLNTLLQSLLTQLENLTTAISAITVTGVLSGGSVSGVPSNAAAITAIGAQISVIATELGGLIS